VSPRSKLRPRLLPGPGTAQFHQSGAWSNGSEYFDERPELALWISITLPGMWERIGDLAQPKPLSPPPRSPDRFPPAA
jgi:hypothetical protein